MIPDERKELVQKNLPTIFLVDDEEIIVQTLAKILNSSGFDATPFTNPEEALAAARKKTPNLILSDVMMPQLSGVDLAITIQVECPNCKIMLFSGQAETTDLLAAARAKGYTFNLLAKPLHPADLLRRIRQEDLVWALGED